MYVSEKGGSDETGDGSEQKPVKTLLQAMKCAGGEPFPKFMVDSKKEGEVSEQKESKVLVVYVQFHHLKMPGMKILKN